MAAPDRPCARSSRDPRNRSRCRSCIVAGEETLGLRELTELVFDRLKALAYARGDLLRIARVIHDARDLLPRHLAIDTENEELALFFEEGSAKPSEGILHLRAKPRRRPGACALHGIEAPELFAAVRTLGCALSLAHERALHQRVHPRSVGALPSERAKTAP